VSVTRETHLPYHVRHACPFLFALTRRKHVLCMSVSVSHMHVFACLPLAGKDIPSSISVYVPFALKACACALVCLNQAKICPLCVLTYVRRMCVLTKYVLCASYVRLN